MTQIHKKNYETQPTKVNKKRKNMNERIQSKKPLSRDEGLYSIKLSVAIYWANTLIKGKVPSIIPFTLDLKTSSPSIASTIAGLH